MSLTLLALSACQTEDVGKACGDPNLTVAAAIAGETPTTTIINVQRDPNCLTFQCLTDDGLAPYCTQSCAFNPKPKGAKACSVASDCTTPLHCDRTGCDPSNPNCQGFCNDDDCPKGFVCDSVQDVGPQAQQLLCRRIIGCATDFDCELSGNHCVTMGCFDSCLLQSGTCNSHLLTCVKESALGCKCSDGSTTCLGPSGAGDAALSCTPPGQASPLSVGAVKQEGVCLQSP